jgi:glycosyltransferase involved in cell wall biosynthesis
MLNQRYESYREAILTANRILTPSKYIRHQYSLNGYPEDRFEVVRLGIDIPSNKSMSVKKLNKSSFEDGLRFLFVGTMIPDKGLDILLHAFKRLENKNVSLIIYGRDDIVPAYYRELLKELSSGDERIVFKGPFNQSERSKVYENCDIVIIPSRFPETFSIVAHEAFVYGKPVIASNIGALPEVVLDGQNGFLVPPGDVHSLLSVMERVIRNPEILSGLDIPGPIHVYSVSDHADYLIDMYREEINTR